MAKKHWQKRREAEGYARITEICSLSMAEGECVFQERK